MRCDGAISLVEIKRYISPYRICKIKSRLNVLGVTDEIEIYS